MKKFLLTSALILSLTLIFSSFGSDLANAWDSGCTGSGPYSITTGQYCGSSYGGSTTTTTVTTIQGCTPYVQYSTITGQYCYGQGGNTSYNTGYTFTRELGLGSRGEDVVQYQQLLTNQGYSVGRIDGVFGSATRRATINYQSAHALPITGNGDTETLNSLTMYSNQVPPVPPSCPLIYINGVPTYSCNNNGNSVTVSSVSGPQSLNTYQSGTWMVNAYSQSGGTLTYSADWGDQPSYYYGTASPYSSQQSASFTHSYNTAGTYTARFTVTNQYGQTAQTSITVVVGGYNNSLAPTISYLSPSSGSTGNQVTIYGTNFSLNGNNTVNFGSTPVYNVYSGNSTSLTFTVPDTGTFNCFTTPCIQNINVSVTNLYGTSNILVFTVNSTQNSTPVISGLSPAYARIGELVTIHGNFTNPAVQVFMGGYQMQTYGSGTDYVSFIVPGNLNAYCPQGMACTMQYVATTPGTYPIYIRVNGQSSAAVNYTITQ